MILHLPGEIALSRFRLDQYLSTLRVHFPQICRIQAFYEYFIETPEPLAETALCSLDQLINAQSPFPRQFDGAATLCLVIPRIGITSPWSTKATQIAHLCGFEQLTRIERGISFYLETDTSVLLPHELTKISPWLHDRMLETVLYSFESISGLFTGDQPSPLNTITVSRDGKAALQKANQDLGLALTEDEITYFYHHYHVLSRDPTDVELMMFAQANSEHCRHKIFNAKWAINGVEQPHTLFDMIRHTHHHHSDGVLLAYTDNAAIFEGSVSERFFCDPVNRVYQAQSEPIHTLIKVETHNHPTAIAPFPGAATGAGGEIRDEGATGRGAKPKAGFTGFCVSHLRIPDFAQPWEMPFKKPSHIASSLDIMLAGPLGSAAFNNEFGRPTIAGYFRTFEYQDKERPHLRRGYHKPIMLAGGMGNIRASDTHKKRISPGDCLVVLGGPALLIGLGGGSASSLKSHQQRVELDFASVQRANPEMQRRCQEVIDQCWGLGDGNPIIAIHDVGAGGLSNAMPELVHESGRGAHIQLRDIPSDDPHLSPLEIWCNEAQERYVMAISPDQLPRFTQIAERERCPFAVVGVATLEPQLIVEDRYFNHRPIDLPLSFLLGKPPKLAMDVTIPPIYYRPDIQTQALTNLFPSSLLAELLPRILAFPCVASKQFLITIGDRTVGGLTARDQMVGPWQVPIADCGVTASSFTGYMGEALAVGERTPLGVMSAPAAAAMALGEAITNIAAACIAQLSDIKLSANWMAATHLENEALALFSAVQLLGLELCPALDLCIPVGKDSLSMQMQWEDEAGTTQQIAAPISPIISAFAPVVDIRKTLTPYLSSDSDTALWFIDLAQGKQRLGGSVLLQTAGYLGESCPTLENPQQLRHFFAAIQALNQANLLLAYHDRSDGGLWATLCEMAFASHVGLDITLPIDADPLAFLCNEELGAVIQIRQSDMAQVKTLLSHYHLQDQVIPIATLNANDTLVIKQAGQDCLVQSRAALQALWAEPSYRIQSLRDNPLTAADEFAALNDSSDLGLHVSLTFDPLIDITAPYVAKSIRPSLAILREQGVNGQLEMAAAFTRAGFTCVDVHMSDLLSGQVHLDQFIGFVAVGGFSYGDVLGAGRGWANTILHHSRLSDAFADFFARKNTFALGVCNGCQMMSHLKSLIPGTSSWPTFVRNHSEQFEARLSLVEIPDSPSLFFQGMQGTRLPVVVSHGEGRAHWSHDTDISLASQTIALHYVDHNGQPTERYPFNPNGSPLGVAGMTNTDGRFTILMPHPERLFRTVQWSWHPTGWGEDSPWLQLFRNARVFVGG